MRCVPAPTICCAQVAALSCVSEADPVAARIGALNTLVRSEDGSLKGFNTDWSAAIGAIEQGLSEQQGTAGASSDHPSPSQSAAKQGAISAMSSEAYTTPGPHPDVLHRLQQSFTIMESNGS